MTTNLDNSKTGANGLPSTAQPAPAKVVAWPDLSIDRRAANQAFEELGDNVSLQRLLERAQEIKDEMLARGGQ